MTTIKYAPLMKELKIFRSSILCLHQMIFIITRPEFNLSACRCYVNMINMVTSKDISEMRRNIMQGVRNYFVG